MIVLVGRFEMAPEDVDAFMASRMEGMRRSREEAGCITYTFGPDPLEPGVVHLVERWESRDHLAAHSARLKTLPPPEPAVELRVRDVRVYEGDEIEMP